MKNALRRNGRNLVSLVLAIIMMLSMTTNVFAGWAAYNNSGTVYLEETWIGSKQCINFYSGGQWKRNVAGESHTLWINSVPVLNNLYETGYWCFDKYGNTWVINTSQGLLLCKADTTTFVINTVVSGCTGFQRDSGKVGYLVYTNNGTYSLEDLLNGKYNTVNSTASNVNNNNNNTSSTELYPYVEQLGYCYYYHVSSTKSYTYYLNDSDLFYLGTNDKDSNVYMAKGVQSITFTNKGHIVFANSNASVDAYPVGKTKASCKIDVGDNFSYFDAVNDISQGYYTISGAYQPFSISSWGNSNININNNKWEEEEDDEYPYVEKDGKYYYIHTSSTNYYKYYYYNSKLYYYGTRYSSANTLISSSVKNVTFDIHEGYVVYALSNTNGDVYALPFGKTSTTYRVKIGTKYSSFDNYYGKYCSKGYTSKTGYYREFADYYDDGYKEVYPYVEYDYDDDYYYIHTSSSRYYVYYLNSSGNLYYKGTNSTSSSTKIASDIEEIIFSEEGYIVYVDEDNEVNSLPLGKTSLSYEEYQGNRFSDFDDDDSDYLCDGYINNRGNYIEFDFD